MALIRRQRRPWGPAAAWLLGGALLAAAACDGPSQLPVRPAPASAWRLVAPRPFPFSINALWGDSPDHLVAVGDYGAVLVKEGGSWRQAPAPTETDIHDVHGCDWRHIYAVSDEGLLFFDGQRWRREGPGDLDDAACVWCRAPDDVMVVTAGGSSFHFDGRTWTRQTLDERPAYTARRWLTGTADGYLAVLGDVSRAWRNGYWQEPIGAGNRFAEFLAVCRVPGADGGERFLAASFANVIMECSAEAGWQPVREGAFDLVGIVPGGVDSPYYVLRAKSTNGDCLVEDAAGALVATMPWLGRWGSLLAFADPGGAPGDRLVLVGRSGTIAEGRVGSGFDHRSGGPILAIADCGVDADGGFTAVDFVHEVVVEGGPEGLLTAPVDGLRIYRGACFPEPGLVWLVGDRQVARLRRGGALEPLEPPVGVGMRAIWSPGGTDLWVGGYEGLYRGDGVTWEPVPLPDDEPVHRIIGLGADDVYVLQRQRILHWNGATLETLHEGSWVYDSAAVAAPDGDGIYCPVDPLQGSGTIDPTLRRFRPQGAQSLAVTPGRPYLAAVLDEGALLLYTHKGLFRGEGDRWSPMPHPLLDRGTGLSLLVGDPRTGLYSVSDDGVIHYLDPGGTGP